MTEPESTSPAPEAWIPLSRAGLARRYNVSRAAITLALQAAKKAHDENPEGFDPPPTPLNPGDIAEVFDPHTFDRFWANRPPVGRPPGT
ncbi:hypothetical protein [Nocardia salmonicida]|uniref:hypothetical protein n=1 Tax=Nocardia salmonicida TaxID=53431 RepID=UPI0007A380C3|nr:hypothetical protein [Nocardia salmonicida]MBC7299536.1 hypothetical protein [Nocardia sp.]